MTPLLARARAVAWFLLLANVAFFFFRPLSFPDLWWQLDDGRQLVHHAAPGPHLSFGAPAKHPVDEYAAYEIALYAAFSAGGLLLLVIGYWAIATAPFLLAFANAFRRSRQTGFIAFALAALCLVLAGYIEQRPAVLGNLFLYLLVIALFHWPEFFLRPKGWLALAILFGLWTNTHSSYVIGLGVLGLFLLERAVRNRRKLASAFGALVISIAATAIHPVGPARWLFTFQQYGDRWGYVVSSEMAPPSLLFQLLIVVALALGLFLYFFSRQKMWWWPVAAFVVTAMSISSYRFCNHEAALLLVALGFPRPETNAIRPAGNALALIGLTCLLSAVLIVTASAEMMLLQPALHRAEPWITPAVSCPDLMDTLDKPAPILTDAIVGSYAYRRGQLHTLNDTGMARYAPETKRYYYYLHKIPAAYSVALDRLHVDQAVVSHHDYIEAAVLNDRRDWHLARILPSGLLYRREAALPLTANQQIQLREFLAQTDPAARVIFAGGLLPDAETLDQLRNTTGYFDEGIYTALGRTLVRLPADEVQKFYDTNGVGLRPAIRLLILEKLGRLEEAAALARKGWWRNFNWEDAIPRARALLLANDPEGARRELALIYPHPKVSPLYRELRHQLGEDSPADSELLWNPATQKWFLQTTDRWNANLGVTAPLSP